VCAYVCRAEVLSGFGQAGKISKLGLAQGLSGLTLVSPCSFLFNGCHRVDPQMNETVNPSLQLRLRLL
jgi:hypothetical protein